LSPAAFAIKGFDIRRSILLLGVVERADDDSMRRTRSAHSTKVAMVAPSLWTEQPARAFEKTGHLAYTRKELIGLQGTANLTAVENVVMSAHSVATQSFADE
jgi:hypothetical protein